MAEVGGIQYPTGTSSHPSAAWWAQLAASTSQAVTNAMQAAISSAASTAAQGDTATLTAANEQASSQLAGARQSLEAAIALRTTGAQVDTKVEAAVKPVRDTVTALEQMTTTGRLSPESLSTTFATHERLVEVATGQEAALTDTAVTGALTGTGNTAKALIDAKADATALAATNAAVAGKVGKGELVVNVRDHGATGDGTTDDRAAIQAALDAGAGGTVVFPPGTYHIASSVTQPTPGGGQFPRYGLRVAAQTTLQGQPGAILTESIDYDNRRVTIFLSGSNITIDGLTIHNTYDQAAGSRPTSIMIGTGDVHDGSLTGPIENITIRDCTFLRSWHPVKFDFNKAGGTATARNVRVVNCTATHETATPANHGLSSGGYNFRSEPPGRIREVMVQGCTDHDSATSAGVGLYGVQDSTVTGCLLAGSGFTGAGIQTENGADNITVTGNTLINNLNGVWVDDSTSVAVVSNVIRNDVAHNDHKGVRVTYQGYTESPSVEVTDITITGNILRNCRIVTEPFSDPFGTPTLGEITVAENSVRIAGAAVTNAVSLSIPAVAVVTGNRVVGGTQRNIRIGAKVNTFAVVTGNYTAKAGAEDSSGFEITNTGAYRPIVTDNHFTNGTAGPVRLTSRVGLTPIQTGDVDPEGAVSSPPGSLYLRTTGGAGTSLYVKESGTGATGWVAK